MEQAMYRAECSRLELQALRPEATVGCMFRVLILGFFKKIFLDKVMEGEREGEKHPSVVASHTPPTEDLAHNPGICPDWESNM